MENYVCLDLEVMGILLVQHGLIMKDSFSITNSIKDKRVKSDEWGTLEITTEHGDKIQIPCHYIDF